MAKFVLKNAFFSWGADDLSDHVESVTINSTIDIPETTSMSDGARTRVAGLRDGTIDVTFRSDFAASEVDVGLAVDHLAGTAKAILIRPDAGVVGPTNPEYSMTGLIGNIVPIGNSVGDVAAVTVTFTNSAAAGIARVEA